MSSIAISNGEDSKSEGKEANLGKTLAFSSFRLQVNILQLISCFSQWYKKCNGFKMDQQIRIKYSKY